MKGRILAVDPGSKRIGIAISDPMRVIATPLTVITHKALADDCARIAELCEKQEATLVVVGQPLGADSEIIPQSRHSQKIAEELSSMVTLPVELWDESGSTKTAKQVKLAGGVGRKKRAGHHDALAAAIILQSYLDAQEKRDGDA